MIFCGQCGSPLAPGIAQCPKCGAKTEESSGQATELHTDDATVATHSLNFPNPPGQPQVVSQQRLVLPPGPGSNNYGTQMAYDATSRVDAANYGTQMAQNPPIVSTYGSNYPPQSGSNYPPQGNYQDFANRTSGTYAAGGYPMNTQGGGYQQPYAQAQTQDTSKVRVVALVLVLLGVLFLFIAIILFVLQRTNAF